MKKFIKLLRIITAVIFIIIGAAGLLIPVFPTVPFLAVAAVILGKKPKDIIKFFRWITKNAHLHLKRIIRRLRKKRLI